ncbi:glycosyltransferase family 2 protein [Haloferax namakaokahaiae]|uniref:Glycosyltransferase family 2 protein n=1 Tax=Haloferax namakaokahaiae TaxID=1748331 RepID=A0ABD5ZK47_9EURY
MYRGKAIGVVVPAHNEESFIGPVIDTMPSFVDRAYIVDDCSRDGTWDEILEHTEQATARRVAPFASDGGQELDSRIVPIRHETQQGRGAAVKTGYRQALADEMDVIAVMDGDGQMDPDILDQILDPVVAGEADYSVGNRLSNTRHLVGMPPFRLFGNVLLMGLTRISSGYWHIRDPQNGYTAVSADTLRDIDMESLYDQYGFLNDMLVKLNVHGKRVASVPMPSRYGDEESGIRYSTFIPKLSALLLRNFVWRLWVKYTKSGVHPVVVLYVIGALATLIGVLQTGWRVLTRRGETERSMQMSLLGVASLLSAMMGDKKNSDELSSSGRRKFRR